MNPIIKDKPTYCQDGFPWVVCKHFDIEYPKCKLYLEKNWNK